MSDLIRREDAIKALYKYSFVSKDVIEKEIKAIPTADRPQDDDWEKYSEKLWKNAYERGKEEEHRWWAEHCANCTDVDRPRGEWIKYAPEDIGCYNCECSLCRERFFIPLRKGEVPYSFCPNCGARMKGADDE